MTPTTPDVVIQSVAGVVGGNRTPVPRATFSDRIEVTGEPGSVITSCDIGDTAETATMLMTCGSVGDIQACNS